MLTVQEAPNRENAQKKGRANERFSPRFREEKKSRTTNTGKKGGNCRTIHWKKTKKESGGLALANRKTREENWLSLGHVFGLWIAE